MSRYFYYFSYANTASAHSLTRQSCLTWIYVPLNQYIFRPESTFSLLITHHPLSGPFAFAVFSAGLSISCLSLTLASSIKKGSQGNPLGMPAGVDSMVRGAQFLGELFFTM